MTVPKLILHYYIIIMIYDTRITIMLSSLLELKFSKECYDNVVSYMLEIKLSKSYYQT